MKHIRGIDMPRHPPCAYRASSFELRASSFELQASSIRLMLSQLMSKSPFERLNTHDVVVDHVLLLTGEINSDPSLYLGGLISMVPA